MILVNSNTRQFNIPGADLVFGVTDDSDVERKHFQCPRYVGDNLDLAACFIRINYRNANGKMDFYLVDDLEISGDNITFSWLLSPRVTEYRGQVKFVMCAVGPDLKLKWHTAQGTGQVMDGLEPDNSHVESQTADVVAQLIAMVVEQTTAVERTGAEQIVAVKATAKAAQDGATAQIEAKGASTLATIPGDYTAVQNAVRTAANAVRGKVSGEVIRVDDVSPIEHYPAVKVHGKNLLPYPYKQSATSLEGVTFTVLPDGGVQASGTPTGYTSINIYEGAPLVKAGKAVLSYSGDFENVSFAIAIYDSGTKLLFSSETWTSSSPILLNLDLYPSAGKWIVYMKRGTVNIPMRGIAYPQLELGDVATEYVPYIDPTTVKVMRCGKNMVSTDANRWSALFPLNSANGVMTGINGSGASNYMYFDTLFPRGTYVARAKFSGFPRFLVRLYGSDGEILTNAHAPNFGAYNEYYKGFFFTSEILNLSIPSVATHWQFGVIFAAGSDIVNTNLTISELQLEMSGSVTEYEPYGGENQIPASNGIAAGLKAISPTMTLLTDKPGVTIECEYSRDTNKVIAEIMEKIAAIGGI